MINPNKTSELGVGEIKRAIKKCICDANYKREVTQEKATLKISVNRQTERPRTRSMNEIRKEYKNERENLEKIENKNRN